MEAKELMIGDCVSVYGQNNDITQKPHWYNRKVTADWLVNMENLDLLNEKLAKRGIFVGHPQIGDVEPIHLTKEILKANGFEYKEAFGQWWQMHNNRTSSLQLITDDIDDVDTLGVIVCDCGSMKLKYVHELQRVLRCCGLWDLADNFKLN